MVLAHSPRPLAKPRVAKRKGDLAWRGISRPAQAHRGRLRNRGRAAQLYPCAHEGGPLSKKQSEKETVHGVPVTQRAQKGCRKRPVCNTVRPILTIVTGWPGPRGRRSLSLAEQQTIGDGLRALTRFCMPRLSAGTTRQRLTLILVRVINTSISTLVPSHRLPPGHPCAIHPVLAATRFDTLDPMPLVFIYNCRDFLFALVCAEVCQANFSPPRSRLRRMCSHSLSRSSAEGTESAAPISTICRKAVTRPQ